MAEKLDENEKKTSRRSRWSVAGITLPSLSGRSLSQERGTDEKKSKGLGGKISFWKRRTANITEYDPQYRVVYLGNVLTGWAKGDGCVDKPLSTLWRNHISSDKADILMKVTIVGSGLRAVTKEHGLTEYWANRITYCTAHPSYPRVFCWIYRHEGRKMKQELRCHAVLCPKEEKARQMAINLQDRLHQALVDFKKEKISRQNARLSLANSIHDNPSMPYRKLLLQTGTCNYKPPIERSKSAPKLTSIEEAELEEEEECDEEMHAMQRKFSEATAEVHVEPSELSDVCSNSPLDIRLPRLPSSSSPIYSQDDAILMFEDDNSDDEDEIKDYIGSGEADSAASESPASQGRASSSCSPTQLSPSGDPDCNSLSDQSDSGHGDGIAASLGRIRISDQDTISDESGYSEEPISAKDVTVVKVNLNGETPPSGNEFLKDDFDTLQNAHKLEIKLRDDRPGQPVTVTSRTVSWSQPINIEVDQFSSSPYNSRESSPRDLYSDSTTNQDSESTPRNLSPLPISPHSPTSVLSTSPREIIVSTSPREIVSTSPRVTDLSVKSVLMSEFNSNEKIRYIERSSMKNSKNTMVLNRQEFCINI